LKNLDVVKQAEEERERDYDEEVTEESKIVKLSKHEEEEKLKELINTITLKESALKDEEEGELDPLDLLSDLRGDDDNTKVLGALSEETLIEEGVIKEQDTQGIDVDDTEETELELKPIEISDEDIETKVNMLLEGKTEKEKTEELTKTGTDTLNFTQSDFDDFDDLKEDMDITKVIIRILIFLIIVAFVIGCIVLLNKLLGLGLF
jgi:hypothetical protein